MTNNNRVLKLFNINGYTGGSFSGNVYDANGVCPTINTAGGGNRQPLVIDNMRIRRITPRETWRLMGFTDEDFDRAEKVNSNSQLYRQSGNSIVVQVLEEIFSQMMEDKRE